MAFLGAVDLGIEILLMKELEAEMSGSEYYEGE